MSRMARVLNAWVACCARPAGSPHARVLWRACRDAPGSAPPSHARGEAGPAGPVPSGRLSERGRLTHLVRRLHGEPEPLHLELGHRAGRLQVDEDAIHRLVEID